MSITGARKKDKRGRPRIDAIPVNVRLHPDIVSSLDQWIDIQPDPKPSRPEVLRKILIEWLTDKGHLK